jgi:acetylornithine deacetylase/succinyl-diaminopimelate desuccinylase-like protein
MEPITSQRDALARVVNRSRLLDTAKRLIAVPSRTGEGGPVAACLADILTSDGFRVERPIGGHPSAPAVVVRLDGGAPGRTLQFNGHLDTVHLPFVPPSHDGRLLKGSGAADMKGGVAAAVEAVRALRDSGLFQAGSVLLTAHDLHEAPWGYGQQLDALIRGGVVGNAVLLPEPLSETLPVAGRGAATWKAIIRRNGPPVHEVMRPADEPNVLAAGAELVGWLMRLGEQLAANHDSLAGCETVFVGQFHGGEIYNQYPSECWLEGTRRWLPGTSRQEVERQFVLLLHQLERDTQVRVKLEFRFIRDAFRLDTGDPLVGSFQQAFEAVSGRTLPTGPKPFVDDGNSFWGLGGVAAITHGPRAGGQHTVSEWVEIDDLVRVATLYALTALTYCATQGERGA